MLTGAEVKALYEAEADTNAFSDAEQTKVGHLTVTQAVNLDQMETDIAALSDGMVYKGNWHASAGTFPGAGVAQTGWFYHVSGAGTVDGIEFAVGDNIVATTDDASALTYAGNWSKHDQTPTPFDDIDYDARADLAAADIAGNVNLVRIAGYSSVGDGGGAPYRRVVSEPSHAGKIQSNDGAWWELADLTVGKVNALSFGMSVTETAGNNATALQAACDAVGDDGQVVVPPGSYALGTVTLTKNTNGPGRFELNAFGASFTGTPIITLDSCKSMSLVGLDMPTGMLKMQGCWFSYFDRCRISVVEFGAAAGTVFSSSFWNKFSRCELQVVDFAGNNGPWNANAFDSCTFRGSANQNFTTSKDYAIELTANVNVQALVFRSCDMSYYNVALWSLGAGNTSGNIEMTFDGCYFDTEEDVPVWTIDRGKTRINVMPNCHHGNIRNNQLDRDLSVMGRGQISLWRGDRHFGVLPYCAINLVSNGDFAAVTAASKPVYSYNGASGLDQSGQGIYDRFHRITQPNTSSNIVYAGRVLAPMKSIYTAQAIVKNGEVGTKTIRWRFYSSADKYGTVLLDDTEWTFLTITADETQAQTEDLRIGFFTDDGTAFTLDVLYLCIAAGTDVPFFMKALA
ncbi:MAG: hypothetical protein ACR2OL_17220 [Anderseniella sp.]